MSFFHSIPFSILIAMTTANAVWAQGPYFEVCPFLNSYACATGLPDTDLDGVEDFLIAQENNFVRVYSGATQTLRLDLYQANPNLDRRVGYSVASLGDVNGDGLGDFAMGTPDDVATAGGNPVFIFSGFDGTQIMAIASPAGEFRFGGRLAGLGDVNGDGVPDLAIASTNHMGTLGGNQGAVYCHSGSDGTLLWMVEGAQVGGLFGVWISNVGDLNSDGVADLGVGAKNALMTQGFEGRLRILSGVDGQTLWTAHGLEPNENLGEFVGPVGDVDLDGIPDVGASGKVVQLTTGHHIMRAFSGATGQLLWSLEGAADDVPIHQIHGSRMAFAPVGDANRDGWPDVAIGEPQALPWGRVWIASGADQRLLAEYASTSNTRWGSLVVPVGDPNRDGELDVLAMGQPTDCAVLLSRVQVVGSTPCSSTPNSTGEEGQLLAAGSLEASDQHLQLVASRLPDQALTQFIASRSGGLTVMPGSHGGVLCLGGTIYRYRRLVGVAEAGSYSVFLPFMPTSVYQPTLLAGQSWHFQAWYADGGGGQFTNSALVTFQ